MTATRSWVQTATGTRCTCTADTGSQPTLSTYSSSFSSWCVLAAEVCTVIRCKIVFYTNDICLILNRSLSLQAPQRAELVRLLGGARRVLCDRGAAAPAQDQRRLDHRRRRRRRHQEGQQQQRQQQQQQQQRHHPDIRGSRHAIGRRKESQLDSSTLLRRGSGVDF